jgi:WD40 repeat protein
LDGKLYVSVSRVKSKNGDSSLRDALLQTALMNPERVIIDVDMSHGISKNLKISPDGSGLVATVGNTLYVWGRPLGKAPQARPAGKKSAKSKSANERDAENFSTISGWLDSYKESGQEVSAAKTVVNVGDDLEQMLYSPDGRWVAGVRASDNVIVLYDARTGVLLAEKGYGQKVRRLSFSVDGRRLAVSTGGGFVRIVDLSAQAPSGSKLAFSAAFKKPAIKKFVNGKGKAYPQVNAVFSPDKDNPFLLIAGLGGGCFLHQDDKNAQALLDQDPNPATDAQRFIQSLDLKYPHFSPDGRFIVDHVPESGSKIKVIDIAGSSIIQPAVDGVRSIVFSTDGQWLALDRDTKDWGEILIFSLKDGRGLPNELAKVFSDPSLSASVDKESIESLAITLGIDLSSDGRYLAVLIGGSVYLTRLRGDDGAPYGPAELSKAMMNFHLRAIGIKGDNWIRFSPDGRGLAVSTQKKLHLWSSAPSDETVSSGGSEIEASLSVAAQDEIEHLERWIAALEKWLVFRDKNLERLPKTASLTAEPETIIPEIADVKPAPLRGLTQKEGADRFRQLPVNS